MWRFEGPKSGITVRVNGEMYSNSALALRKAAMAGLGIGLVPRYVVADDLAAGTLVSILNRFRVPSRMLHAIYPDAETTPAKIGIFVDFLTKWLVTRGIGLTA
jgi:DNA-binding transcriptional LysR family regulator